MAQNIDIVENLKQTTDRNRYFYGKLMTVRDFLQEQQYFNSKRWLINRLLFGSGVVCGLSARPAGEGMEVEIDAGIGFDQLGREITVLRRERYDVRNLRINPPLVQSGAPPQRRMRLCLVYHECPKEPVPSVKSSPCDEVCESNRISETFTVELRPAPDPSAPPPADMCEDWLNRGTDEGGTRQFLVERTAPRWVRGDEVFEVALKVTGLEEGAPVRLTERVTGDGALVEPTPAPSGQSSQFPTPPVTLRPGEFFIYIYQVRAASMKGATTPTKTITLASTNVQSLASTVEIVSEQEARRREAAMRFSDCGEKITGEPCVDVAMLTVNLDGTQITGVSQFSELDAPRRYNLERVAHLLDCLRENLQREAGSARPGHAFITFKDTERSDALPISAVAKPGNSYTVARGDHVHSLLFYQDSGLEFPGNGNRLRINGEIGGERITFLDNVSGQTPKLPQHLATKGYVDERMAGLDWQESVKSKELRTPPDEDVKIEDEGPRLPPIPASERSILPLPTPEPPKLAEGNRYLLYHDDLRGAWEGHTNEIATWNGREWLFARPDEATAVFVEDESVAYLFVERKWTPFLATPQLAAGNGLTAEGAFLSVGQGAGLRVGADDVSVVFRNSQMHPVGRTGNAGSSNVAARGDHTHAVPLAISSGLEFVEGKDDTDDKSGTFETTDILPLPTPQPMGLRVNGVVGGDAIDFDFPVSGQDPLLPRHLATKRYVDAKVAGLDWQESVRTKELTSPPYMQRFGGTESSLPRSGGDYTARASGDAPEGDDAPTIRAEDTNDSPPILREDDGSGGPPPAEDTDPIILSPPLSNSFVRPGDRFLLFHERLAGAWEGRHGDIAVYAPTREETFAWTFQTPTEGTAVFVEDENVAYLYVEGKWTPFLATPAVAAGAGLVADGAVLSVGAGAGVVVGANDVALNFESYAGRVRPVSMASDAGGGDMVARADHTHAFPLAEGSGFEFVPGDVTTDTARSIAEEPRPGGVGGFRINGGISGDQIAFKHPVTGVEPVMGEHLTTKNYVDTAIDTAVAGLDWQASVLTKDLVSPPVSPAPRRGDRYLIMTDAPQGDWAGHGGHIAIKASRGWSYKEPDEGMAVFVEDKNLSYLYADGKWTEFLAAPSPIQAGYGLTRTEAEISVGQGEGIVVSPDAVSVAFSPSAPPPVAGAQFADPAQLVGVAASSARSDHTHVLPLAAASGLEFGRGATADEGFRIGGDIGGAGIRFLNPVGGQEPVEPQHLATKNYVDSKQATQTTQTTPVVAGDGLINNANGLSVGAGAGIKVNPDSVEVIFATTAPPSIGSVNSIGSGVTVARSNHTHALALAVQGGLEFSAGQLRVGGLIASDTIDFQRPVSGQTPTLARHLTTKDYVDTKVGGATASLVAGNGLMRVGDMFAVGPGAGLAVSADAVAIAFSNTPAAPLGIAAPGVANTAAREDHVHPTPTRTTGTSTGFLEFAPPPGSTQIDSAFIPLDRNESDSFSVQVGLVTGKNRVTFGDIAGTSARRHFPPISLAVEVFHGGDDGLTFGFRVMASSAQGLPASFTVHYIIFRPQSTMSSGGTSAAKI